jgi:Doubled CXXCH motif (Paired_CXXCH_1)
LKDKKHIIVLFSMLLFVLIALYIADRILQPETYGQYGNYRWAANNEILKQEMLNQNSATCGECHTEIHKLKQKDAHYNVPCVDCHGAGNVHVAYFRGDSIKGISRESATLPKEYELEGCLYCHRQLKARPADFPQINQSEHYGFLKVSDLKTKCIECHSPHEPLFLLSDVQKSRIHPIVHKCADCHKDNPVKSPKEVENHPTVFECKDCHGSIVKEFSTKSHSKHIECRTCHQFHKENESAGRIFKNGNAKFCLMCHEKKSFKDEKYPPKIDWPGHVGNSNIVSKIDEKICLNCHKDQVHEMDLNKRENPHSVNWMSQHREFGASSRDVCQKCHTSNSCTNCHMQNKPASHKADWSKTHKDFGAKNPSSCENCHRKNSCNSCHGLEMPHPKDFGDTHKEFIVQKGKALCSNCHNEDFCKSCH